MFMKKLFLLLALFVCAFASAQDFATCDVRDLALIYQGGAHRWDWNESDIEPYVTHSFADGTEDWLFDGFLFLEFKDGKGRQFSPGYDKINATRADWEWYIDRLFEKGKSLHALDAVISAKKKALGEPGFRHKVVLTLMVPIGGQTDWGEVDGRKLDFNNGADRKAAICWFADALIDRFKTEGFENLDLYGFYWIDEDMVSSRELLPEISPYVHSKGMKFVWIPYFKAAGHERWRELGFDIAYHQPNHFFQSEIPDERLDIAIDEALACGMAMEFECDERALSQSPDAFAPRMTAYIDAFERRGVFERSALAYYTGSHLLTDFVRNPSAENAALADRFARIICSRRSKL